MPAAAVHLGIVTVLTLACYFEIAEWLRKRRLRNPRAMNWRARLPKQVTIKRPL